MNLTRNHLLSLSLGSVAGFTAGAFVTAQYLYGAVAVVMGFWSLVIGLIVAPPVISRRSRQAILDGLQDPELTAPIVESLAASMALRFDVEMLAPADTPKPVLAAVNRISKAMMVSIERTFDATEQHVKRELAESGIMEDETEARYRAVEEGAIQAGLNPALIAKGRFLIGVKKFLDHMPGKSGQAALPSGKRKGPVSGRDGYL